MNRAKHPAIWLIALSLMLSWFLASQTARAGELDRLIDRLKHDDSKVRAEAARTLGKLGDKQAVQPLIAAMKDDENARVRVSVASALGRLGDKRAVEPLIAALKDENNSFNSLVVRVSVASALGRLGDRRAVAPLIAALKDKSGLVRRSAGWALAKLDWQPATNLQRAYYLVASKKWAEAVKVGPCAVEPLIVALKDIVASVRLSAAEALGKLGDKRAVEPLIAKLEDGDREVRESVMEALGKLGDERALEPLIAVMKDDENARVRLSANQALERLRWQPGTDLEQAYRLVASQKWAEVVKLGPSAVEPLITALKDTDHNVRRSAAGAWAKLDWQPATDLQRAYYLVASQKWAEAVKLGPSAVEPLLVALKGKDFAVQQSAREALAKIGPLAVEPLIAALKDEDAEVGRMAASALGSLGDPRAIEPLITALKDEDRKVRFGAAQALGRLGDKRAVEPLIAALKDKDAWVRGSVAGALGELGDKQAVEPLRTALRYNDGRVLSSAAFALAQLLGEEHAVEPLLAVLEDPECFDGMVVTMMLIRIGPPAVEPLIAALKHEDKRVRYTAASVLVNLDDKRAVEPLITVLKGEYHDMLRPEGKALEGIGPSTVEQLIALLKHKDMFYVRSSSAWVLGWLGDKRAVEPLVAALGDAQVVGNAWVTRVQAAVALGRLGDKRAIEPLVGVLKRIAPLMDKDSAVLMQLSGQADLWRQSVVKILDSLVKIGPPAVEPLIGVLKDENACMRSFAAEGLGKLGDQRAVQPLVAVLKDEDEDEEVRRSATEALRKLGWQPGTDVE